MENGVETPVWRRVSILGYGFLAYLVALISVLYFVGFLANIGVPKGIDEGPVVPLAETVAVDVGLTILFGIQHSVMARSWLKDRWTRVIPEPVQRSTCVLATGIVLYATAWLWRLIPTVIWKIDGIAGWILWGVFGFGLVFAILATFQNNHAEFTGLQQVLVYHQDRDLASVPFHTPGFYRYTRNPVVLGILIWIWATPQMTAGHLLLAVGFTVYNLIGVPLEERKLSDNFGDEYREYRQTVPRFVPVLGVQSTRYRRSLARAGIESGPSSVRQADR